MRHRIDPSRHLAGVTGLFSKMLFTGYTVGGFIYILLVITMVEMLVQVISG
jgi:hypothetical protein